jgi:phage gpG-like protein
VTQTFTGNSFDVLQEVMDDIALQFEEMDFVPYLETELPLLEQMHAGYFATQTGPDGNSWPKNAPRTIKRKGHSRVLRGIPNEGFRLSRSLTQRLRHSTEDAIRETIQERDGAAYLGFGTTRPYHAVQQEGNGKIPARPHLGMTEKHVDGAVTRCVDYALANLAK